MTLKELYAEIDGNYDQAISVLRIEKLVDKHIKKLPTNPIFTELEEAGKTLDGARIFESAHAIKGVCSNLGLVKIAALASDLSEEFRPGNARTLGDGQVKEKIALIMALRDKAVEGISRYEQSGQ